MYLQSDYKKNKSVPNSKVFITDSVLMKQIQGRAKIESHASISESWNTPTHYIIPSTEMHMLDFYTLQLRTAGLCTMNKNAK